MIRICDHCHAHWLEACVSCVAASYGTLGLSRVNLILDCGMLLQVPIMGLAFYFMLHNWLASVKKLSTFSNCSMTHVEETIDESSGDSTGSDPQDDTESAQTSTSTFTA